MRHRARGVGQEGRQAMSYDVMVFDPAAAPVEREAFLAWYGKVMDAEDYLDHRDAAETSPALQAWFHDLRRDYPAMNGPQAASEAVNGDDDRLTDYLIGPAAIYAEFRWSQAETALQRVLQTARAHGVGVYCCSERDGAVWAPAADGGYLCRHRDRDGESTLTLTAGAVIATPARDSGEA